MTQPDDLLPIGLEDALPARAAAITRAMRQVLGAMDSHGYDRVRPPLVEFEKSLAGRMEGVATRRMVRFTDPESLRTLALRSDITVQVGRIAATSLADAPRPLRLCYAGEVASLKADQLDPARQRLQLGAELIGSDSVAAAIEAVTVALDALEAAGLTGLSVDFTLPDLVDTLAEKALPLAEEKRGAIRRELDMKDAGGLKAAGGEDYLPLLYATGPFDEAIEKLAAIDAGGVLASRIAGLKEVVAALGDRARLTLDPSERHGFEYQSWFGFTLHASGARAALGRGGTYAIKGSEEAATGFSLYMEPLLEALGNHDARAREAVFLPLGHDRKAAAKLRSDGWRTVAAIEAGDEAAALGCTHVLDAGQAKVL
ncbi:ATP phosphoribosyltransferase regulatory subunit [Qipengyuania sp. 1NDW9]|uniref:ATP phosphoribosyltransferase regulatory subunit n=1 Tax=Qipengyuania xiapuensis TaxID=2867236 RepID=UPI001C86A562|nr:ATP phosphoribosyltransferase regulatory subunit [Qipengyuania xiapuensis]MBX7492408.1 ATP phosphoribosyltransferase regulatory subunit [Qipengyuania xiapuensis]